jgi:hypothetical protein
VRVSGGEARNQRKSDPSTAYAADAAAVAAAESAS